MLLASTPILVSLSVIINVATCQPIPVHTGQATKTSPQRSSEGGITNRHGNDHVVNSTKHVVSADMDSRPRRIREPKRISEVIPISRPMTHLEKAKYHSDQTRRYSKQEKKVYSFIRSPLLEVGQDIVKHGQEAAKHANAAFTGLEEVQEGYRISQRPINRSVATSKAVEHGLRSAGSAVLAAGGSTIAPVLTLANSHYHGMPMVIHSAATIAHNAMHNYETGSSGGYLKLLRDEVTKDKQD